MYSFFSSDFLNLWKFKFTEIELIFTYSWQEGLLPSLLRFHFSGHVSCQLSWSTASNKVNCEKFPLWDFIKYSLTQLYSHETDLIQKFLIRTFSPIPNEHKVLSTLKICKIDLIVNDGVKCEYEQSEKKYLIIMKTYWFLEDDDIEGSITDHELNRRSVSERDFNEICKLFTFSFEGSPEKKISWCL